MADDNYYTPMDRAYHAGFQRTDRRSDNLEEPLFPIRMVGQTVPEIDQTGRNRNIVEGVEAAFRGGAGNIQLVMQVPGQISAIGGGPKAYGDEVREAIREIQKVAGARITGVELPTQVNNLSGFAQDRFSEEQRRTYLEEVKDTIKFVGDIAGGGSVDLVSFEFPRNFSDANWAKKDKNFKMKGEERPMIVDTETGSIQAFHPNQTFFLHRNPENNKIDTDHVYKWQWKDFKTWADKENKKPEEMWVKYYLKTAQEEDLSSQRSMVLMHKLEAEEGLEQYKRALGQATTDEEKRKFQNRLDIYNERMKSSIMNEQALHEKEEKLKKIEEQYKTIGDVGFKKSAESYGEAGIWALQESQKNQFVQKGKGSIHVGPEISWPQYFGSHPDEWIDLIRTSRKEMARQLTDKDSAYYDSSMTKGQAEQAAKQHIKGMLDTSHLVMWLQNFKPELPWDQRVGEFKKWYKGQIEHIAEVNKKEDIIGGVQLVDSATGAHGHLPPGQGILGKDVYEYMKILKEKGGYKGEITSEGHEEEKFGQGRILTKAWESLGSPIGSGYWYGRPAPQFRDIRYSQSQSGYGTTGIFQSYVPSNDFTLWSNVPLE